MWSPWTVVVVVVTGLLPAVQADMPNTTVYHQSADQLIRVRGEKERKGRVEVRMSAESSRWYPVCYDVDIFTRDTMPNIALWLCETQLGLNVSRATIILGDVLPSDTQFALAVCSSRGNCSFSLAQECVTTRSWIAYCPAPNSTDFTVRLTGGVSERKGGVETLIDGKWLPICSTLFDAKDAEVVCRQLGFRDSTVKVHKYHKFRTPGGNAMMLSFGCRGNESRLIECHQVSLRVSVPCSYIATVECESRKKDYSPRLGDKSINFFGSSGRLEVYLRGNWMPVCDARTIDDNVARVACREMGLPSTPAFAILGTSLYRWDNILDRENVSFECRGTEKSLSECTREVVHVCNGTVRIVCSEFSDYEVRLVGGNRKAGRVELRIGNVWGTICSQGFSDREAGVVCQKLGYFRAIKTVRPNEGFGQAAPDSVVWPFEFSCKGDEHSLEKCTRRRVTSGRCTHDKDVAVSCESSDDGMGLRLVGGTSVNSGRLEVHFNGLWGTVCRNDFSSSAAKVACRQMGLPR
ncbi:scavenger receptor cysteine-rich type 1 protein M160-like [Liolophura sinensis]|uniref:scavenger receptor cysteine-rich type 1 protein M160-like n=1 Tax=Liolophura sinensis TaxID=3198878 RepID=UPI003158FE58